MSALINIVVFTIFDKVESIRNVIVIEPSLLDVENVGTTVIFDGAWPLANVIAANTASITSFCITGVITDATRPLLEGK